MIMQHIAIQHSSSYKEKTSTGEPRELTIIDIEGKMRSYLHATPYWTLTLAADTKTEAGVAAKRVEGV